MSQQDSPQPRRVSVKFFANPQPGAALDLAPYIGLFHQFIQEKSVEGLLIDVADYTHVPDGPGILLVGHDVDYGIDLAGGRAGLLTVRKRIEGSSFAEALRDTLVKSTGAIAAIHGSDVDQLQFATDALEIQCRDRLALPNTAGGFDAASAALAPLLAEAFGDAKTDITNDAADDARSPLTLRVVAQSPPDAVALLANLRS